MLVALEPVSTPVLGSPSSSRSLAPVRPPLTDMLSATLLPASIGRRNRLRALAGGFVDHGTLSLRVRRGKNGSARTGPYGRWKCNQAECGQQEAAVIPGVKRIL